MLHMILLPLLAIIGGAAGFFLRRWELSTAFNEEGLPTGAPATYTLILLCVVLAAIFFLFCLRYKDKPAPSGEAFFCPGNRAYLVFCLIAAALLPAAAVVGLVTELNALSANLLRVLFWILCIPSGVCIALSGVRNFRARSGQYSLALLLPAFICCFWLVVTCQRCAADPVVLNYVYELFAIICTLLSVYFTASLSFVRTKVWPCILFSLLGLFFSIVTSADRHDAASVILLVFAALYQLIHVTVLLKRSFPRKKYLPKRLNKEKSQEVFPHE